MFLAAKKYMPSKAAVREAAAKSDAALREYATRGDVAFREAAARGKAFILPERVVCGSCQYIPEINLWPPPPLVHPPSQPLGVSLGLPLGLPLAYP